MHEPDREATVWGRIKIVFVIFLAMPLVSRHQMASWLHADIFHPIEHVEGDKRAGCPGAANSAWQN